jgi:putative ABC transport system permease protein
MDVNDLVPGDVITIDIDGETLDLVIDGVMKDAAFPNSDMIGATRFLLNENDFEKIRQYPVFRDSDIYGVLGFVNTADPDSVAKLISGVGGVSISRKQIPLFYLMDFISVFLMIVFSVALVAVSSVTIHFSVNFNFEEDFREIGILKAIGLENRKIRRINTIKYMAVAAVGSIAGFFLSIPFAKAVLISTEQKMIMANDLSFVPNLLGCLFVAVCVTANAWISTGKIKKFSPIDAIRYGSAGERFTGFAVFPHRFIWP